MIVFEALAPDIHPPSRSTEHSAGYDLRAHLEHGVVRIYRQELDRIVDERPIAAGGTDRSFVELQPGDRALVPTGFRARLPEGYEGQIRVRSSIAWKKGLQVPNAPGTVDADYPDEWFILIQNTSSRPQRVSHGERIGAGVGRGRGECEHGPGRRSGEHGKLAVPQRTVFCVSDDTGVTAEHLGRSLMSQFRERVEFRQVTLPFVSTPEKANDAVEVINRAAAADGIRPIVFATLVGDPVREIIRTSDGLLIDFLETFLGPLEAELGMQSAHAMGRAHGMSDVATYNRRIDATNFALGHDDGVKMWEFDRADLILIGVSRTGKTPTCLYLALQYGIYSANSPLNEDDFRRDRIPESLLDYSDKLFALTISADRLAQIRQERLPDSRYASLQQVEYEIAEAHRLYEKYNVPYLDTTQSSIEEISATILDRTGLERRI